MNRYRPFMMGQMTHRMFSQIYKPKSMGIEMLERLKILQNNHEKDPKNVQAAFMYFKELNRVGMYHTVVRLYQKQDYEGSDKLKMQYDYAIDHLDQVRGLVNASMLYTNNEDISQHQSVPKYLFKRIFQLIWR